MDNNTGLIYRNYNKKLNIKEIVKIKEYCSKKKIKFILSNNLKIALSLNLDGGSSTHLVIGEKGGSSGVTGFDHVPVGIGVFKR